MAEKGFKGLGRGEGERPISYTTKKRKNKRCSVRRLLVTVDRDGAGRSE